MPRSVAEEGDMITEPIALSGVPGSPYTRKMLAVLRYRRIGYRFLTRLDLLEALPAPKVRLLPTFYLPRPDGTLEAVTDSTPILRRLDDAFAVRRVRPVDPALALIDALIEDYGDEWLTKCMFHYRWHYPADIERAARVLPNWMRGPLDDEALAALGRAFADRQIARLRYVGSNEVTAPVIEASYARLLSILERHFSRHAFLLGARPGAADFGIFGQLTQLACFDPTPIALTARMAPRVMAWTHAMEDLSGLEPAEADWIDAAELPDTIRDLLAEIGRVYAPLLLANAAAIAAGASEVTTEIDGQAWSQQPFPYQVKCLSWLRAEYQALDAASRATVDHKLAGTGCELLFATA